MAEEIPLLSSLADICAACRVQETHLRNFCKLGMPHRIINGRYFAHKDVVNQWLQYFLNPAVSGGPVEVTVGDGVPENFCQNNHVKRF